jgi:hypothetical protein
MATDIKFTFVTLEKETGQKAQKRIYSLTEGITAKYQLRYYYLQGYTRQDKKILDIFTDGEGPTDQGIAEDRSNNKSKSKTPYEELLKNQFSYHSKDILLEHDILDPAALKESKETQKALDEMVQRYENGSYRNYILGTFYEYELSRVRSMQEAIEMYKEGFETQFCQYCATKLLRMNLETMELKQPTFQQNFEVAMDICGFIFSNNGVFFYIDHDYYCSPIFYYLSVMMDIFVDFREFIYLK